ncbi:flagellar motor switch protein FliN [Synergistales bacterium]|nr:flagellar motor switch protein FliN [Synergistales bacterium]
MDEFLNQDEINALLSGAQDSSSGGSLSSEDASMLGEVMNIISGATSNVVGMLAGRDVSVEIGEQSELPQNTIGEGIEGTKVFDYTMDISGMDSAPGRLYTSERGALILADLMMGGDAKELAPEANDLYLSAAQEGLSQLIGSALTSLSGLMGGVRLSAENTTSSLDDIETWRPFPERAEDAHVWVGRMSVTVEGVDPFAMNFSMPLDNAEAMAATIRAAMAPEEPESAPAATSASAPAPQPAAAPQYAAPVAAAPPQQVALPPRPQGPPVDARPVEFAQLGNANYAGAPGNIDLIVDIPVRVTVELGRTRKTIGEVLALGPGSVVELNKMAGEPVDVLVNGKLIARGEVVVIDESFGIRVTEVVSKAERIRSMGV